MGSGKLLHIAYEKYGIENFTKLILKFFDSADEAFEYEAKIVNEELVKDNNCYNIRQGGTGWNTYGLATVRDKDGNCFDVPVTDPRYLSGELVGITKGYGVYISTITGEFVKAKKTDKQVLSGEYVGITTIKAIVKGSNGKSFLVDKDDPRYLSGELKSPSCGKVVIKDKDNKYYQVSTDDPRYLSGELVPLWTGRKHKQETKDKVKKTFKEIQHLQGEKNSQFGTCWIYNDVQNKKIKKEELQYYLDLGWIKGRKMDLK